MEHTGSQPQAVQYGGVRVWPDRIELISAGSVVSSVKQAEVRRLAVKHGWQSDFMVRGLLFGAGMLVIEWFPLRALIDRLVYGGTIYIETIVMLLIPAALAAWAFVQALRRGLYLEIELDRGQRKFPIQGPEDAGQIRAFLRVAGQLGYVVAQ